MTDNQIIAFLKTLSNMRNLADLGIVLENRLFAVFEKFNLAQSLLRLGFGFVAAKHPAGVLRHHHVLVFYLLDHTKL